MTRPTALSELGVLVRGRGSNYPTVRLIIDGEDHLDLRGTETGNDPDQILHNGALLPHDPARRIAFYGCGCGEFGCFVIAGLISEVAGVVSWTDFRTVTGVYHAALPAAADGPDHAYPIWADDGEWAETHHRRLNLPDLAFDATQYHRAVQAAAQDRSWETHTRAVLRHLRNRSPALASWATQDSNHIEFQQATPGGRWTSVPVNLEVPPGAPADVAARLVALLEQGLDLRDIDRDGLWRSEPAR